MKSIKELYRIGTGPSSSHTMAPRRAAEQFLARHPEAAAFRVTLYGSLAATGRGHMTDRAIIDTLLPTAPVDIVWQAREFLPFHPNGMRFQALDTAGTPHRHMDGLQHRRRRAGRRGRTAAAGGGDLRNEHARRNPRLVPPGRTYWEYVEECESDDIWDYLAEIWQAMRESVERGLDHEGVLPGPLHLTRRAATYHVRASGYKQSLQSRGLVFAYALAVAEENASGGRIVTAPDLRVERRGAGRVVPSSKEPRFLRRTHLPRVGHGRPVRQRRQTQRLDLGRRSGLPGRGGRRLRHGGRRSQPAFRRQPLADRVCRRNGARTPSGHDLRSRMRPGADPCIERNAYAAARALDANLYSAFTDGGHRVSFDRVVEVMKQTGHDLPSIYKETGEGGLAREYDPDK